MSETEDRFWKEKKKFKKMRRLLYIAFSFTEKRRRNREREKRKKLRKEKLLNLKGGKYLVERF